MAQDRAAQLIELAKSVGRQLSNNERIAEETEEDDDGDAGPARDTR